MQNVGPQTPIRTHFVRSFDGFYCSLGTLSWLCLKWFLFVSLAREVPGGGRDCHFPKGIVGFGPIPARFRGFLIFILALSTARSWMGLLQIKHPLQAGPNAARRKAATFVAPQRGRRIISIGVVSYASCKNIVRFILRLIQFKTKACKANKFHEFRKI